MESEEIYPADWLIPFPSSCDIATVWEILNSNLICKWSWDLFIWDLTRLHWLLSERPAIFDYLYVTQFLKSRAATLAKSGPFSSCQVMVLEGIAQYRLQYAAIYRFLFMFALEHAMATRDESPGLGLSNGRLFRVDIGMIEKTYLEILDVISLMPDTDAVVHGYKIKDWMAGVLPVDGKAAISIVPPPVSVPVDIHEMGWYRKVKPTPTELALKIMAQDRIRFFRQRDGNETTCDRELERLCGWEKMGGYPLIKCGDDYIEYYGVTVHDNKQTLYVVCADCTMRLMQAGVSPPACRPLEIYLGWPRKARKACSLEREVEYLVEFDDGTSDVFRVSFRGHLENEKPDVPRCVWAKAIAVRRGEGSVGRGRLAGGSGPLAVDNGQGQLAVGNVGESGKDDAKSEERLPVDVMRDMVVGLLKLKPELRDVVAWRFAGIRYDDIALAQGVTRACAEKRHRRAMELWPALRSLFPRKVAKQERRRSGRRDRRAAKRRERKR